MRTSATSAISLGAIFCVLGGAGCGDIVPPALGTRIGEPILLGVEPGSELQLGSLASSPLRVNLDTTTGESAYHSTWSLGPGLCLEVLPRSGGAVRVEGAPISAEYYHLGRVLFVSVGEEGAQELSSFVEPVSYRTVPCPVAETAEVVPATDGRAE